jgi:hypothetical protein
MNTQKQSEEIKKLKLIILELIGVIQDISIDRDDRLEIDSRTLYELKNKLRDTDL